jgi:hypothetical protein
MIPAMTDEQPPRTTSQQLFNRTDGEPSMAPAIILTALLLPAGLLYALILGQKARREGHSQQPLWVGFAIGVVIDIVVAILLSR